MWYVKNRNSDEVSFKWKGYSYDIHIKCDVASQWWCRWQGDNYDMYIKWWCGKLVMMLRHGKTIMRAFVFQKK